MYSKIKQLTVENYVSEVFGKVSFCNSNYTAVTKRQSFNDILDQLLKIVGSLSISFVFKICKLKTLKRNIMQSNFLTMKNRSLCRDYFENISNNRSYIWTRYNI